MTLQRLIENITDWLKNKTSGVITIFLHEGGIRKVRIEQDVK